MTLDGLELGRTAPIAAIDRQDALAQRLMAMGFLPGAAVRVVQVAPLGDPITVEIDGWRVSLRRAEAAAVRVDEA